MIQSKNISPGPFNLEINAISSLWTTPLVIPKAFGKYSKHTGKTTAMNSHAQDSLMDFIVSQIFNYRTFLWKSSSTTHNPEFGLYYCFYPWLAYCRFIL